MNVAFGLKASYQQKQFDRMVNGDVVSVLTALSEPLGSQRHVHEQTDLMLFQTLYRDMRIQQSMYGVEDFDQFVELVHQTAIQCVNKTGSYYHKVVLQHARNLRDKWTGQGELTAGQRALQEGFTGIDVGIKGGVTERQLEKAILGASVPMSIAEHLEMIVLSDQWSLQASTFLPRKRSVG